MLIGWNKRSEFSSSKPSKPRAKTAQKKFWNYQLIVWTSAQTEWTSLTALPVYRGLEQRHQFLAYDYSICLQYTFYVACAMGELPRSYSLAGGRRHIS
jgi:hypothetical protein